MNRDFFRRLHRALDQFSETTGRSLAWLNIGLVLVTCLVVFLRYWLNTGSIALQESALYIHGTIFLLASAYTLKHDEHVRVDIFYQHFNARKRAWVNLLGSVFLLLPVFAFIGYLSWSYISASWMIRESSQEAGGLPAVFLLKSLILVMVAQMILQGLSETLKNVLVLLDNAPQQDREARP